jgi:NADPH:quinone reductase-like Zn-dependent oxidoreductase
MRTIIRSGSSKYLVAFADRPEPVVGPDEILVAVERFSLNRGELALLRHRPDGWMPGQEIVGTVIAEAVAGDGPPAGARVVALVPGGGWAERVAITATATATLTDKIDLSFATALPLAGLTALRTLRLCGPLLGRSVLLTAGAGGVGQLQIQLAVIAGAQVTAIIRDQAMRDRIAATIPSAHLVDRLDACDDRFDVVLDSIGGDMLGSAFKRLRPDGQVVSFGNSAGAGSAFSIFDFIGAEGTTLRTYFSYHHSNPVADDLASLVRLGHLEKLRLIAATVRPWNRIEDALGAMLSDAPKTKQILTL